MLEKITSHHFSLNCFIHIMIVPSTRYKSEIRNEFIRLKKQCVLPKIIVINNVFEDSFEKQRNDLLDFVLKSNDSIPRAFAFGKFEISERNKVLYKFFEKNKLECPVTLIVLPSTDSKLIDIIKNLPLGYLINVI